MRIWDIDPGYLNDKSLLGEHLEIHAVFTIIAQDKKGYSKHPETLRWKDRLDAISIRHKLLVSEMQIRGLKHKSPMNCPVHLKANGWPEIFINPPADQFAILEKKYNDNPQGRIALPVCTQTLWAAHKYSVLARDPALYKDIGRKVAEGTFDFDRLSLDLVEQLRRPPEPGRLYNGLLHMWGYITDKPKTGCDKISFTGLLNLIREAAVKENIRYLLNSTALGELSYWCRINDKKGENNERSSDT